MEIVGARQTRRPLPLALLLALAATPGFAHVDVEEHGSVLAGLSHPLLGLVPVLAMTAAGLWGPVIGGPARRALPTSFVGAMVGGFGVVPLGLAEPVVLASVLALGPAAALMAGPLPSGWARTDGASMARCVPSSCRRFTWSVVQPPNSLRRHPSAERGRAERAPRLGYRWALRDQRVDPDRSLATISGGS